MLDVQVQGTGSCGIALGVPSARHNRQMTILLRLDQTHLPLWRDATTIQLGEHAGTRLTDVSSWQERLLVDLTRGLPDSGIDVWAEFHRVHPRDVRSFLARLGDSLHRIDLDRPDTPGGIVLEIPRGGAQDPLAVAVRMGLESAAYRLVVTEEADPGEHDRPWPEASGADLVVLLARHVLDPRRAAPHLRADRAHLPIVVGGAGVVIGPLIVPGTTACATCLYLERRDADGAWPVLALQLLAAGPPTVPTELAHESAAAVLRLLGDPRAAEGVSVTLTAGGERRQQVHRQHDMCGCRAPEGNARALAPLSRSQQTMTARPTALPA